MKANELRIGNWFNTLDGNHVLDDISTFESCVGLGQMKYDLMTIQPIPLTVEWLLMFGFEKRGYDCEQYGVGVVYVLNNIDDGFILEYCDDFSCGILDSDDAIGITPPLHVLRHVHQLQNLYFALTGEELTIDK